MMKLSTSNGIVVGQLKTSRTETVEEYLRTRLNSLAVVGFMSPFSNYSEARCTLYHKGLKVREFGLPNYIIKHITGMNQFLIILSFISYMVALFASIIRLRRRFDLYVGIATFSALMGLIFKRMGITKRFIYYCIDYYPSPPTIGLNRIINIVIKIIDRLCIKYADMVWDISPRIKEAREEFNHIPADSYMSIVTPLGYTKQVQRTCPPANKELWTLGFVGSLSENQGLQLIVDAMPNLKERFPEIKVRIIGHGPFGETLKERIRERGLNDRFIFHGFVKNDDEVFDILSRCMIGLATWTGEETDNSLYADPGKPKLYALLGLPIIITSAPLVSELITWTGAGVVIDYSANQLVQAVEKIIGSPTGIRDYLNGVENFKPYCMANTIFDNSFVETFNSWS